MGGGGLRGKKFMFSQEASNFSFFTISVGIFLVSISSGHYQQTLCHAGALITEFLVMSHIPLGPPFHDYILNDFC